MKILILIFTLLLATFSQQVKAWSLPTKSKIEPRLAKSLNLFAKTNVMIKLANTTDAILATIASLEFGSREERLNAVVNALQAHAALTQGPVLQTLGRFFGLDINPYWIDNEIFVKGANKLVVQAVAALPVVGSVTEEFFVNLHNEKPTFESVLIETKMARQGGSIPYGITKIRAPDVWNLGYKGQNIITANIDTGVRLRHEALYSRYRGNYGWYDPAGKTAEPNDDNGHGTHTMGTISGSGGIGVAPSSTWMACKGCGSSCSNNVLTACGQFIACPHGTAGPESGKDCTKAPHVVNNSWGGGQGSTWYNSIVNAWRAAGIIPVFSAGNSGSRGCGSSNSPGDQPNLISVGSTDSSDRLAYYSSRGPSVQGRVKPEIAAPGSNVKSSWHSGNTAYSTISGTSMAAPHVAGVVALLQSKNPKLTYDQIFKYITDTVDRSSLSGGANCGGKDDTRDWPNNSFGYGRINALNAIKAF